MGFIEYDTISDLLVARVDYAEVVDGITSGIHDLQGPQDGGK